MLNLNHFHYSLVNHDLEYIWYIFKLTFVKYILNLIFLDSKLCIFSTALCLLTSNNWGVIKEPWGHYGGEEHMFLNSLNTSSVRQVKIRVKEGRSWNKKKKKKVEHHLIDHHHRLLRFYPENILTQVYLNPIFDSFYSVPKVYWQFILPSIIFQQVWNKASQMLK